MNKIVELAIKNANDKLAKKQAGDRLKQIIDTIKNGVTNTVKNPNFQKGAGNAIIGTGAGLGTYMGSRALGNDKKRAAKHGVLAGTAVAGGKTLYDYKAQLKDKFEKLFKVGNHKYDTVSKVTDPAKVTPEQAHQNIKKFGKFWGDAIRQHGVEQRQKAAESKADAMNKQDALNAQQTQLPK